MRLILLSFSVLSASLAGAAPLVDTGFEPSINALGGLHGQAANGPAPWTSTGATVVNTGPTLGLQSARYSSLLASGAYDHHSRVNLVPSGGIFIPAGWSLKASVDVYNDPNTPEVVTGLSGWANSHTDEHAFFGLSGDGWRLARHGNGPLAPIVGNIANPPDTGWHNIALYVQQTSANTLTTTYSLDGGSPYTHNGFTIATHVGTVGFLNQISDFSLVTYNRGSSSANIMGIYDNFRVELVPEPGSLVVLGLGLALALRRKQG